MRGYAYCKIWEHTANVYHGSFLSFQFQSSFLSIMMNIVKLFSAILKWLPHMLLLESVIA
jgi:hypothetical protein